MGMIGGMIKLIKGLIEKLSGK
ncbi:alpha family phenol-soluble modulin [Staphylococcus aureus]